MPASAQVAALKPKLYPHANYTQPNFELGYALKFMRLELLILTALFDWIGFAAGSILIICSICFNKTLSGRSYLNVKLN